ncbi:hypothetical protein ACHAXT_009140 [Thalassiosira profunda]
MLSLLLRPRGSAGGTVARCLAAKRRQSALAAAAAHPSSSCTIHQRPAGRGDVPRDINHPSHRGAPIRYTSKYARVDHAAAYQEQMAAQHGVQLKLALEEGRGRDAMPFDPFSQFLDEMGSTSEVLLDDEEDTGEEGFEEGGDKIEEAEYEEIEGVGGGDQLDDAAEAVRQASMVDEDMEMDEDEDEDDGPIYTNTGALYRPKSERLALRAGYPAGGKFAVINLAGFQHKVTQDDLMVVNKLKPVSEWSVGSTHTIKGDDVLLVADQDQTLVGLPGVKGGEVDVMVEEITRDKTLVVFKKRRRKNSRRKNGFRRQVTFLRVLDVRMPGEVAKSSEGAAGGGMVAVGAAAATATGARRGFQKVTVNGDGGGRAGRRPRHDSDSEDGSGGNRPRRRRGRRH